MNTRQYLWWERKKRSYIGIIAVCYLSSLMNLIIAGGRQLTNTVKKEGRKKKEKKKFDRISSFLFPLNIDIYKYR
jgi:hypothetical protein